MLVVAASYRGQRGVHRPPAPGLMADRTALSGGSCGARLDPGRMGSSRSVPQPRPRAHAGRTIVAAWCQKTPGGVRRGGGREWVRALSRREDHTRSYQSVRTIYSAVLFRPGSGAPKGIGSLRARADRPPRVLLRRLSLALSSCNINISTHRSCKLM